MLAAIIWTTVVVARSPDSPGVKTLKAFIETLNTNDVPKMERFILTHFHDRTATMPEITARATRFMQLNSLGSPFTFGETLTDTPTLVVVTVKSAAGSDYEIKMSFAAEEPHLALSVYMGGPGSQSGPPSKHYTKWRDLNDLLGQIRTDTKVPAICAAFFRDGTEQSEVVGTRRLDRPEAAVISDRWLLGSITKSMTAMMVARLIDRRILRWDTTIAEVLPNMQMRPEYRSVTVLQLLRHRAGVVQDLYVNPEFLATAAGTSTDRVEMREHYTRFILAREPIGKPGEQMRYSNAGYAVVSHLAEVATQKSYEQLMTELVFNPLKMTSAKFGVPGAAGNPGGKDQLMGYLDGKDGFEPYVLTEPRLSGTQAAAGAGLSMTLEDLLKFAKYNLEGLRGQVTLMGTENFNTLHRPADTSPGAQKYACGWVITDGLTREPFHGHDGSDGTFRAEMAIWPEKNLAIVAIANAGSKTEPSPPLQAVVALYEKFDRDRKK